MARRVDRARRAVRRAPSSSLATAVRLADGAGDPDARATSPRSSSRSAASRAASTSCCREIERARRRRATRSAWRAILPARVPRRRRRGRARAGAYDRAVGGERRDAAHHALADRHGLAMRGRRGARRRARRRTPLRRARALRRPARPVELHRERRLRATGCSAEPQRSRADATRRARHFEAALARHAATGSPAAPGPHALRLRRVPAAREQTCPGRAGSCATRPQRLTDSE